MHLTALNSGIRPQLLSAIQAQYELQGFQVYVYVIARTHLKASTFRRRWINVNFHHLQAYGRRICSLEMLPSQWVKWCSGGEGRETQVWRHSSVSTSPRQCGKVKCSLPCQFTNCKGGQIIYLLERNPEVSTRQCHIWLLSETGEEQEHHSV